MYRPRHKNASLKILACEDNYLQFRHNSDIAEITIQLSENRTFIWFNCQKSN